MDPRGNGSKSTTHCVRKQENIQTKLFVGNLSFETTADELRELFAPAGEVVNVSLPTDRDTGRPRGFAFVEFASDEAAAAAIAKFDRQELNGRALRVDQATERPSGGGGSRPGGFGDRPSAPRSRPKGSRRNLRARKRGF